jgi:hypothetical protein
MLLAAIQRDRSSFAMGAIVGGGFGLGFMTAAAWCLGYEYAPGYIDWWKMWELNAGFSLGLLYAVALYWCIRRVDATHGPDGKPLAQALDCGTLQPNAMTWNTRVALETLAVFAMVLTIYLEGETAVSMAIGLLYVVFISWLMLKAGRGLAIDVAAELRGGISLSFTVFLFLFVTLHGATSTMGIMLELYPPESVDQYAWPPERVLLFLPMAVAVAVGVTYHLVRILVTPAQAKTAFERSRISDRVVDLMTGLAAVGAISIWPSKIGALYAVFLAFGLWALNALNRPYVQESGE